MKKFILIAFYLVCFHQIAFSGEADTLYFYKSMAKALKEASKTNRIVFLDAYTTWCGPCKKMNEITFRDKEVVQFMKKNFICVKLDMERGEGTKYAKIYQIGGYPTFLFLDSEGKMVHSDAGFKDAAMFLNLCKEAMDPELRLAGLDEKFAKGELESDQLLAYIQKRAILMNASQDKPVDAFLKYSPDWKQSSAMEFIMKFVGNPGSLGFLYLLENKKAFISRFGATQVNSKIENVINEELMKGTHRAGIEEMSKVLKLVYPENADRMIAKYKVTYFASIFDGQSFMVAAENYLASFPPEDPAELADISFQLSGISKNKNDLKKAMVWVEDAFKKEENFECQLATAFLFNAMGKGKRARKAAQKAIKWAKDNGENYLPAEQFISTL